MKISLKLPIIIVPLVLVVLFSCKTPKNTASDKSDTMAKFISETIKSNFTDNDSVQIIPNNNKSFYLLVAESAITPATPTSNIKFVVISSENQELVYKNHFSNSIIKWFDSKQLLLTQFFGILDQATDKSKAYLLINCETSEVKEVSSEIINNP
ncbi:MAG: hypothetical protein AB7S50_14885 [Bacteroidales bacterium]